MLVADENTNPYFKELCDAAKEIAELKAQISRLEKVVDGVLAQHLAGQEPSAGVMIAPDAPSHLETQDTFQDNHDFEDHDGALLNADADEPILIETAHDSDWDHDGDHDMVAVAETDHDVAVDTEEKTDVNAPTCPGALPNALRTLICRPLKPVLTSPDDLTLIKGIDCATALQLASHGISSFQDIADLNAEKIEDLCAKIEDANRMHKQVWIEQAAVLADEKLTTFARESLENRKTEDTTFTLKPDLIPLETLSDTTTHDVTASEIIIDDKIDVAGLVTDHATATLNDLSSQDMPRHIHIERPMTDLIRTGENVTSFIPMAAVDAGFAIKKIAHVAPRPERDFGNMRALAASLAAAAVIYVASTTTGAVSFDTSLVQIMQADVCKLASWSSYPDACKQIFGIVL